MTTAGRKAARGLLVLVLAVAALAQAAEHRRPRYARRLDPPMRDEVFRKPRCVTADLHTGEVFVCDTLEHGLSIFDERGVFRYRIHGGAGFRAPLDVAVDPDGYLFVAGRHGADPAVVRLDYDGLFLGVVDLRPWPFDDPPEPLSLALAPAGDRLYVLDQTHHALVVADREGRVETVVDLVAGMEPDEAREQLYGHVDAYGDAVLVARPTLGRIDVFDPDGAARGHVGVFGTGRCQCAFPRAAALDELGNVLILDQRRMMFTLWDPRSNRCLDEYYSMGRHPGGLYAPEDLSLDADGRVYVAQTFEGRVQVYEGGEPAARPLKPAPTSNESSAPNRPAPGR